MMRRFTNCKVCKKIEEKLIIHEFYDITPEK